MDESDESNKSILQTRMMATGEFEAKKDKRFHNDNSATKVTARGHLVLSLLLGALRWYQVEKNRTNLIVFTDA